MTATALFWVVIGGALGATLRYAVAVLIGSEAFPWATILSNIAVSLIIGVIWGACADQAWFQGWGRLFLVVGLLGAFTTYSAFALETLLLLQSDRILMAALYCLATLMTCLLAVWFGMRLGQWVS